MPFNPAESSEEPPRKKIRKGTRSCWEWRVVQRLDAGVVAERQPSPSWVGQSTRSASPPGITPSAQESAPVLSLFNNSLPGLHRSEPEHKNSTRSGEDPELQKLRTGLLALLPSQLTVDTLGSENDLAAFSNKHPVAIAKALLWITICLQQLPPSFDISSLDLARPSKEFIEQCVSVTTTLVCSHDSLVRNVDGLECLVLQAIFHNNNGKLRRAWLCYRNALNVAQLLGLHRPMAQERNGHLSRGKKIWRHILFADRYLSLMLGMCHGTFDAALDNPTSDAMDKLFLAAGSIIERNQIFNGHTPDMIRKTQLIDAELAEINPGEINTVSVETSFDAKTSVTAYQYAKLMAQLWHFQLVAWLHLPLMLDSTSQQRYEYNRQSCLDASRRMITIYIAIRNLTGESFCCKSLDFQAFTAAVTLLINVLRPEGHSYHSSEDREAINKVMEILQRLSASQPDDVASRSLGVLRTLRDLSSGETSSNRTTEDRPTSLKLSIPYFGTIMLDRNVDQSTTDPVPETVVGTLATVSQSGDYAVSGSLRIDDANFLYQGGMSAEEQSSGLWSFDPNLVTQSYFSAEFSEDIDWGF
ncbi:fungal specific transcription factor domain-containing protein [Aspergillus affinis]|uniref:fungal specific transcription factor domain-containing protein n=1 Tax=Aspergillus affinis TaxID=1070780 RepID=UPI0022FE364B|nr:uncharacterized protein KD926_003408 [Aspergillus affinis]KAI9043638.1 hypothetical protein KD926_003408 [Aspergillus affinis]